jgi:hypothetical protein
MIFSFGGLSPVSTMLIIEGATPLFFAHSFWPPARFTSERSKRTTSFWSSARMSVFRTAASVGGLVRLFGYREQSNPAFERETAGTLSLG